VKWDAKGMNGNHFEISGTGTYDADPTQLHRSTNTIEMSINIT